VPKSGCSALDAPQLAISVEELESTGADEMSVFHALSGGKIWRPPRSPLPFPQAWTVTDWPAADTTTAWAKYVDPSVQVAWTWPFASLVVALALIVPEPVDGCHVTVVPGATCTTTGEPRADPNVPVWLSPLTTVRLVPDGPVAVCPLPHATNVANATRYRMR
jgi:hypothetical protein